MAVNRFLVNSWGSDSYFHWQWEGCRCSYYFQIMHRLYRYEKDCLFCSRSLWDMEVTHIAILIIAALHLEWKQQELLRSFVHHERSMDYITPLFVEMVTARHILLSKTYMVQLNLLRSLNVSVTFKNVSVQGFVIWKKKTSTKGLEKIAKITNTKIDTIQNYFGIALRSNVGNPEAMKLTCMALIYHICGYHNSCP